MAGAAPLLPPGVEVGEVGPEGLEPRPVEPRLAAAVGHLARAGHGIDDDLPDGPLGRRLGHHDAVAVEEGLREDVGEVGHVVEGDLLRVRLARGDEDLPGCARGAPSPPACPRGCRRAAACPCPPPRRRGPSAGRRRTSRAAITSGARTRPSLSASSSASVRRVDLEPLRRAGQRDPELLVEPVDVAEVVRAVELDLVEPADAVEPPPVRGGAGRRCHAVHLVEGAYILPNDGVQRRAWMGILLVHVRGGNEGGGTGTPDPGDPQHRDHGPHRRGEDHALRALPLRGRPHPQDGRGPRRRWPSWTGWTSSGSAGSPSPRR